MQAEILYTRRSLGIDYKVWLTMILFILLFAFLAGYNFMKKKDKPCTPTEIFINGISNTQGLSFNAGDILKFRSHTSSDDAVVWDFGDNTQKQNDYSPTHVYSKAGIYFVKLSVNEV